MVSLGVKNISKSKYTGAYDGVPYDFQPGELRILDSDIAMHLMSNSNLAAIGGQALKVIPMNDIPEELKKDPETKTDTLMGVKNPSKEVVEVMFDGRFFSFPAGHVHYYPKSVAEELVNRSAEAKTPLVKVDSKIEKPAAPTREEVKKDKKSKEDKKEDHND